MSRRHRSRSQSPHRAFGRRDRPPPRETTWRSSSLHEYRQRDDYGRYDHYDYDDGYRRQDNSHYRVGHFSRQGPNVTYINNYNYGHAPPSNAPMGNRGRPGDDRGRSRQPRHPERPRASQTPYAPAAPAAPKSSAGPATIESQGPAEPGPAGTAIQRRSTEAEDSGGNEG